MVQARLQGEVFLGDVLASQSSEPIANSRHMLKQTIFYRITRNIMM